MVRFGEKTGETLSFYLDRKKSRCDELNEKKLMTQKTFVIKDYAIFSNSLCLKI